MPEAKSRHCTAVLEGGNVVFVAGGVGSKSCYMYERGSDAWRRIAGKQLHKAVTQSCIKKNIGIVQELSARQEQIG
jgi:hypothetical protein